MQRAKLLVDAKEFWLSLKTDLESANQEVLMQMMTFEGDATGRKVVDALLASRARTRKVLVDSYTRFVQQDKFIYHPFRLFDRALHAQVRRTSEMFAKLREDGGEVRYAKPVGPLFANFAARNHKKIIVVDTRIVYIGGFNFSDHNFAWHDLMVRIEDSELANFFREDFTATWNGCNQPSHGRFDEAEVLLLNGIENEKSFAYLTSILVSARESLTIVSPYLTFPFCAAVAELPKRGVPVTLVTPRENNKGIVRDYLLWEATRCNFDVRLFDGMSHMKAALVDDRFLVVGSSNFDFLSYRVEEEVVVILSSPDIIRDFRKQVLEPDLLRCTPDSQKPSALRGWTSYGVLRAVDGLAALASRIDARRRN